MVHRCITTCTDAVTRANHRDLLNAWLSMVTSVENVMTSGRVAKCNTAAICTSTDVSQQTQAKQ